MTRVECGDVKKTWSGKFTKHNLRKVGQVMSGLDCLFFLPPILFIALFPDTSCHFFSPYLIFLPPQYSLSNWFFSLSLFPLYIYLLPIFFLIFPPSRLHYLWTDIAKCEKWHSARQRHCWHCAWWLGTTKLSWCLMLPFLWEILAAWPSPGVGQAGCPLLGQRSDVPQTIKRIRWRDPLPACSEAVLNTE